jgi:hypothetical protein
MTRLADAFARSPLLILAGAGSSVAAVLHLACLVVGPSAFRVFGAGPGMVRRAEEGDALPYLMAAAIAAVLATWALYAWSGAGLVRRLPFLRTVLAAIAAVYLVRGLAFPLLQPWFPGNSAAFWLVTSAICVLLGALYGLGLWRTWPRLAPAGSSAMPADAAE